ncbi:MAG: glycosyltransferase [Deltaproteobacteria bacterium]|nr:glycosyltransferase [Deltaproteobacteria bacterium]
MRVAWVSSWDRICGIADYSKVLWPEIKTCLAAQGHCDNLLISLDEFKSKKSLLNQINLLQPDIIHFQHEYGFFGGKNPPFYFFPSLIKNIKTRFPNIKLIATAHTVLSKKYHYPLSGLGFEIPLRWFLNMFFIKKLNILWGASTWGLLDTVIVHSNYQVQDIIDSGCKNVKVIPLYNSKCQPLQSKKSETKKVILVFGFFSEDKGQDIAIEAFQYLPKNYKLILAGGVRRKKDQKYMEYCLKHIANFNLGNQVEITGYVAAQDIKGYFEQSDLVLAPFRQTTGSASLAQALSYGTAILASDLLLNREIVERVPNAIEFFKSGNPYDCALQIERLCSQPELIQQLRSSAKKYSETFSVGNIALEHLKLYLK